MGKKATEVLGQAAEGSLPRGSLAPEEIFLEEEYNDYQEEGGRARRPLAGVEKRAPRVRKERKSRTYNPDDRFLEGHIKQYYLFPFHYARKFPYFKVSWKYWKPNSVYKEMARFLSNLPGLPNKTSIQCKSFDQRMKDVHYVSQNPENQVDLLQAAIKYLSEVPVTPSDRAVIDEYLQRMSQKSHYIDFLLAMEWEDSEGEVALEKNVETCIESNNPEIIFNEFLDIDR